MVGSAVERVERVMVPKVRFHSCALRFKKVLRADLQGRLQLSFARLVSRFWRY